MSMSSHELALELVKTEKDKPSTADQNKSAIALFEEYFQKVTKALDSE